MKDTTLIFMVACGLTVSWFFILFVVPRWTTSLVRYRLWRIRDRVVDLKFAGKLPASDLVDNLVARIECSIERAHMLTFLRLLVFSIAHSIVGSSNTTILADIKALESQIESFSNDEKELFTSLEREYEMTCVGFVFYGCPSGWLVLAPLMLVALPIGGFKVLISKLGDSLHTLFKCYFRPPSRSDSLHRHSTRTLARFAS